MPKLILHSLQVNIRGGGFPPAILPHRSQSRQAMGNAPTSRKAKTLPGFTICETMSPRPNSRPAENAESISISVSDQVTGDQNSDDGGGHEHRMPTISRPQAI